MSTNSLIGVTHGDNFKMIYCHFDGYLTGVGAMLHKHFDSPRANHLVALGDLSVLAENICAPADSNHSFDTPTPGVCVFYGRDRNDDVDQEFDTLVGVDEFNEYISEFAYTYLMHNDQWYVIRAGETFAEAKLLEDELKNLSS